MPIFSEKYFFEQVKKKLNINDVIEPTGNLSCQDDIPIIANALRRNYIKDDDLYQNLLNKILSLSQDYVIDCIIALKTANTTNHSAVNNFISALLHRLDWSKISIYKLLTEERTPDRFKQLVVINDNEKFLNECKSFLQQTPSTPELAYTTLAEKGKMDRWENLIQCATQQEWQLDEAIKFDDYPLVQKIHEDSLFEIQHKINYPNNNSYYSKLARVNRRYPDGGWFNRIRVLLMKADAPEWKPKYDVGKIQASRSSTTQTQRGSSDADVLLKLKTENRKVTDPTDENGIPLSRISVVMQKADSTDSKNRNRFFSGFTNILNFFLKKNSAQSSDQSKSREAEQNRVRQQY